MIREYGFEKLSVWQNARKLVKEIYCLIRSSPVAEKYGLISQIQRATVSVSSNIAEGSSRSSDRDQGHFYQTAYASLMEVLCQLTLCLDLKYINKVTYIETRDSVDIIAYQLSQLRNAAIRKPSQPSQPYKLPKPAKQ